MSAQGPHKITAEFEKMLGEYTGAPYVLAVDNCSNAIALCLWWWIEHHGIKPIIHIPSRTYMSVPCEIILSGCQVRFVPSSSPNLTGAYQLNPTNIWDCALRFTSDMYEKGSMMCLSFTGPYKHLKLGKGGAILLDSLLPYEWLKRARNSGRGECSYHDDSFTQLGRNCYMMPQVAAQGILLMAQFRNPDGSKQKNPDLTLPYPDLSRFKIYQR